MAKRKQYKLELPHDLKTKRSWQQLQNYSAWFLSEKPAGLSKLEKAVLQHYPTVDSTLLLRCVDDAFRASLSGTADDPWTPTDYRAFLIRTRLRIIAEGMAESEHRFGREGAARVVLEAVRDLESMGVHYGHTEEQLQDQNSEREHLDAILARLAEQAIADSQDASDQPID